ncbi:MAG: MATE family efflux transporter [Lachnospiraceae bacterium]|nr:MATE family efflux transporter [Lachnospiraceae bacterium]
MTEQVVKKKKSIIMTEGPIAGPMLRFILPLIGSSLFQQLYNTVDFLFVGNVMTKTSAAAVGASSTLIAITIGLFSGISVGTSVVASQAIGSNDKEKGEKVIHTSVAFGIIGGLIIMVLGIIFAPGILGILRTPTEVMPEAVTYIRIYLISVPMLVFYNMVCGGVRASGDSKTPFTVLVICGFLNVVMDYLLIVIIPLGVAGVSIATAITQSVSAVLIYRKAASPDQELRLSLKKLKIDKDILKAVLRIGLPAGLQTIIITFSNVMVQYYINSFGETSVAAFAAYYKVENLFWLPIVAFGQAATTFSGQNFGAGKYRRIRKGALINVLMGVGTILVIMALILSFPRTVFTWFIKDQDVVTEALKIAWVSFPLYWIYPILEVVGGFVRGMGYSISSMAIVITSQCVIRVALLAIFSRVFGTIEGLAWVYPISWACAAISFCLVFVYLINKFIRQNPDCE